MRKLIVISSLALFALLLAGCGGGEAASSSNEPPKADSDGGVANERGGAPLGDAGEPKEVKISPDGTP